MFPKLQVKIILMLVLTLFITLLANNMLLSYTFKREYSDALKSEVFAACESLKLQLERLLMLGLSLEEVIGFDEQCKEAIDKHEDVSFAYVVGNDGTILFHYSNVQEDIGKVFVSEILGAMGSDSSELVQFTCPLRGGCYAFIVPVMDIDNHRVGSVILGLPKMEITKKLAALNIYSSSISLLFFITSLLLITFVLSSWVTKPLNILDNATRGISSKGIDAFKEVSIRSKDEIGRLASSFNNMALELKKTTVSKTYMDNIFSSMIDSLIVTDSNMIIQTVNKAACRLLKYQEAELTGESIGKILVESNDAAFSETSLTTLMESGRIENYETYYRTKNGIIIPVLLSCSIIKDESGKTKNIIFTSKDITEQRKIREALRLQTEELARSNAELQEFTYIASHDLQEPLRKINIFSSRFKDKYFNSLDERGQDYLQRIQSASVRMRTLINNLLEYSTISTKDQSYSSVNLNDIAWEVISDLEVMIEQSEGYIEVDELPIIDAEPTQMRQLFQNLIGNALKFHREGIAPVVKIYCMSGFEYQNSRIDRHEPVNICEIVFEDNGIGIDEKNFDRVFNLFQRLHGRSEYEGTGVGLPICHKIVTRHRGTIKIESKYGEGTKFIVRLPMKQHEQIDLHNG